jgi:predicted amidophosphoribosyltransferase
MDVYEVDAERGLALGLLSIEETCRASIEHRKRVKVEGIMVYDRSQIETKDLRLCGVCRAEPHERDKFCRRCGARLDTSVEAQSVGAAFSSARDTSSLPQYMYTLVSGRLLAAAASSLSLHVAPLRNRLFKWLISALLSIPIWLIIVLLSPLDAYTTAKTITKQI